LSVMFSRWWPRLTVVWPKSTLLTGSLGLNNPAENLGRHSLPPLNRISSRDSTTRLEQHFLLRQGCKDAIFTHLHFHIARIQIGPKIHGALLTASTQFMRERAMDVYMENYKKANSANDADVHRCKRPTEGLEHLHELSHGQRWS
jgi:hypothetical protein